MKLFTKLLMVLVGLFVLIAVVMAGFLAWGTDRNLTEEYQAENSEWTQTITSAGWSRNICLSPLSMVTYIPRESTPARPIRPISSDRRVGPAGLEPTTSAL